jgi:glycosyltransferase involved in cell wall biosynthesis
MYKKLAIIAPYIGPVSQTFIQRHMKHIMPRETIIIAKKKDNKYIENWDIDCPQLILQDLLQLGLIHQARQKIARKLKLRDSYEKIAVKKFLKKHKTQVIMGEFLDFSLPWLSLAQELDIPFYAHAHGYDVSARLRKPEWQKRYQELNQASGIITMNKPSRDRLIKLGINPEKINIIHYGVSVPNYYITREKKDTINCLAVGRMVPKKAPILLLDAFRRAVEFYPNLRLDYVGDGILLSAIKQFIIAFNLSNKVTLHESQSHEFVYQIMEQSDIFIQHSITDPDTGDEEGLPLSILEAMAHSLPIVSTKHAGIPEAIIDDETGFLVKERNSVEMAEKIIELATNHDKRAKFGYLGWKRAKEKFSWERERQELCNFMNLEIK